MKAKKPLFLVAFAVLVVVLMLGITGLAAAAPATAVKGDVTFVDWPEGSDPIVDTSSGTWTSPGNVIIWTLSGDLEGTYTLHATYSGKTSNLRDEITGTATFKGTLKGAPITWSATVKGSGKADPAYYFAGRNYWISTLVGDHKGQITIHQHWVFNLDPFIDWSDAVYSGEIK